MVRVLAPLCAAVLLPETQPAEQEPSPKGIALLIERLGDEEFDAREKARKGLEKIGDPAWGALVKARDRHTDPEVRRQARKALETILQTRLVRLVADLGEPKKRDAAAKDLTALLNKADEKAQREAGKAALVEAMKKHKDAEVRKAAADVLRRAYADRIKKMIEQLGAEEFDKRNEAEGWLLGLGAVALPAVKEAVKSPDLETRAVRARRIVRLLDQEGVR